MSTIAHRVQVHNLQASTEYKEGGSAHTQASSLWE